MPPGGSSGCQDVRGGSSVMERRLGHVATVGDVWYLEPRRFWCSPPPSTTVLILQGDTRAKDRKAGEEGVAVWEEIPPPALPAKPFCFPVPLLCPSGHVGRLAMVMARESLQDTPRGKE